MSCKDVQGNNWSLLFDNLDAMRAFLRVVMACVAQVCQKAPSGTELKSFVVGLLPGSTSASR